LRYAVAKAAYAGAVWGICGSFWKLGKRRAVVVEGVGLAGREEAVMRMLLKGWASLALGSVDLGGERSSDYARRMPLRLFR
jgi:hypothetical protein